MPNAPSGSFSWAMLGSARGLGGRWSRHPAAEAADVGPPRSVHEPPHRDGADGDRRGASLRAAPTVPVPGPPGGGDAQDRSLRRHDVSGVTAGSPPASHQIGRPSRGRSTRPAPAARVPWTSGRLLRGPLPASAPSGTGTALPWLCCHTLSRGGLAGVSGGPRPGRHCRPLELDLPHARSRAAGRAAFHVGPPGPRRTSGYGMTALASGSTLSEQNRAMRRGRFRRKAAARPPVHRLRDRGHRRSSSHAVRIPALGGSANRSTSGAGRGPLSGTAGTMPAWHLGQNPPRVRQRRASSC